MKTRSLTKIILDLIKFRILLFAYLTFLLGYFFAYSGQSFSVLLISSIGFILTASGSASLNHMMEFEQDTLMNRTKKRPIPSNEVSKSNVLLFSVILIISGLSILFVFSTFVSFIYSLLLVLLYNFVYTPFKKISWLNTFIGAIPGAIPVMIGWSACSGLSYSFLSLSIFGVFFLWQLPHFFSIAWLYRDDYENAGFKMISLNDLNASKTKVWLIISSFLLLFMSLVPTYLNVLSVVYATVALILGLLFIWVSYKFCLKVSDHTARLVLRYSIIYQFVIMLAMVLDLKFVS